MNTPVNSDEQELALFKEAIIKKAESISEEVFQDLITGLAVYRVKWTEFQNTKKETPRSNSISGQWEEIVSSRVEKTYDGDYSDLKQEFRECFIPLSLVAELVRGSVEGFLTSGNPRRQKLAEDIVSINQTYEETIEKFKSLKAQEYEKMKMQQEAEERNRQASHARFMAQKRTEAAERTQRAAAAALNAAMWKSIPTGTDDEPPF